ncbi:hypothetical protein PR202_ga21387 [Eleusine coracana subsp. coracana]|uniref:DEUBAD domain-containing protein n=1 Tax=Eleusine coracana subsp. coracana TaxID=191504 RepID=A0AAV5D185_ELECO|nr:hypothetical protein QOZ80_8AG0636110 [Eleusine coracana subsp. coracana]GJN03892.1 hypothetical protein PR202_ga21387 [Eleusine coracana subsp. coracana]
MGIVKIVCGEPEVKDISSYGDRDDDLTKDEIMLLQSFPSHESDDSDEAEVGCELAMSRGQICNVPYELYDLPELTEVLSLETWNLRLTEDDRVRLAAYLPDMDRGEFCTTMKELLSGDAMFFGSPLRSVFHRLNSGFYSPEVSQARELLMTLEKRRHYHFLKLYHNGIVRKFASVDRLLRSSNMVPISHNWRSANHFEYVGLSSSNLPLIVNDDSSAFSPLKRAKLMNKTLTTQCSTSHNETVRIAKLAESNSSESESIHSSKPNSSIPPKGVLKTRTGCDYHTDVSEGVHRIPGLILVNQLGTQSTSFFPRPHTFAHNLQGFAENSSSHGNKISSGSSPLQWKAAPETYAMMAKSPLGVQMTVPDELRAVYPSVTLGGFYHPVANHTSPYVSEACHTRELPPMKNLLKNFAPDQYIRVSGGHQVNEYTTMHSLRNAENISQMLNIGTRIYPPSNKFAEQLETVRQYHGGMKLAKSVTEVKEHQLPGTYSKRKLHKRSLDIVDPVKSSAMVEDTVSPSVLSSMANMKATTIKL